MAGVFRFSFGPWNIREGTDPFGPPVRDTIEFNDKLGVYKELGFDGVQFHDDDAVPSLNDLSSGPDRQRGRRRPNNPPGSHARQTAGVPNNIQDKEYVQ